MGTRRLALATVLGLGLALLLLGLLRVAPSAVQAQKVVDIDRRTTAGTSSQAIAILVDDFTPPPHPAYPPYRYNRLSGECNALGNVALEWGDGEVTVTIVSGSWGGLWASLNYPNGARKPVNFAAILPSQIISRYQGSITGLTIQVSGATPGSHFKAELKNEQVSYAPVWSGRVTLTGGAQALSWSLPSLMDITNLNWFLEDAGAGDYVVVDHIVLTATVPITDVPLAAFVWSYGTLLNNWDPATGLVRDKARYVSGEFDAIQATGGLAAASAVAAQLGVIDPSSALQIVTRISNTLLISVPRHSSGLWPHFVEVLPSGVITIAHNPKVISEWSSIDTVIATIGLLEAQSASGLDTSGTEQMLRDVHWRGLLRADGISFGYEYDGTPIPGAWDVFGGESWLVQLAYAAAEGKVGPVKYCTPPTANGSGFIDELAWLFVPPPPMDCWGTDWAQYRRDAANEQISYYCDQDPGSCFCRLGLFGLSAGEVPVPWAVDGGSVYRAFGVGGRFSSPVDSAPVLSDSTVLAAPVVVPHYSAMIASLCPTEANTMWTWLIHQASFSPLNNVESLAFPPGSACDAAEVQWNDLKGSWNLVLQTLGWGRYLAERDGQVPVLWQAITVTTFLSDGYALVASTPVTAVRISGPDVVLLNAPARFTASHEPANAPEPITFTWSNRNTGSVATYTWHLTGTGTVAVTATCHCANLLTDTHVVEVLSPAIYLPVMLKNYS